jgi:hypothetical protein
MPFFAAHWTTQQSAVASTFERAIHPAELSAQCYALFATLVQPVEYANIETHQPAQRTTHLSAQHSTELSAFVVSEQSTLRTAQLSPKFCAVRTTVLSPFSPALVAPNSTAVHPTQ